MTDRISSRCQTIWPSAFGYWFIRHAVTSASSADLRARAASGSPPTHHYYYHYNSWPRRFGFEVSFAVPAYIHISCCVCVLSHRRAPEHAVQAVANLQEWLRPRLRLQEEAHISKTAPCEHSNDAGNESIDGGIRTHDVEPLVMISSSLCLYYFALSPLFDSADGGM